MAENDTQQTVYKGTMSIGGKSIEVILPYDDGQNVVWTEIVTNNCYAPIPGIGNVSRIVDVGANVGLASAYFRLHYEQAEIVSIEPDGRAYFFLEKNATSIGGCKTFFCGLSNCNSAANLFQMDSSVYSTKMAYSNTMGQQEIKLFNAPEMFHGVGIDNIDILKMDTEGFEIPILHSLYRDYIQNVKVIYLEFHSHVDRMMIESLLTPTHVLWRARIDNMNRGVVAYVNRSCETLQLADTAL